MRTVPAPARRPPPIPAPAVGASAFPAAKPSAAAARAARRATALLPPSALVFSFAAPAPAPTPPLAPALALAWARTRTFSASSAPTFFAALPPSACSPAPRPSAVVTVKSTKGRAQGLHSWHTYSPAYLTGSVGGGALETPRSKSTDFDGVQYSARMFVYIRCNG